MGVEAVGDARCDNCKKMKSGIFKVVNNQYYCEECVEKLGSQDFINAMKYLDEEFKSEKQVERKKR